jgi:hypothetical protein
MEQNKSLFEAWENGVGFSHTLVAKTGNATSAANECQGKQITS